MKKVCLLLFLFYAVPILAQPQYTNPIVFLNDYCKKTGWDQWNNTRTVRIAKQVEGSQTTFTDIYQGEWGNAKIDKPTFDSPESRLVRTIEKAWTVNANGKFEKVYNVPNGVSISSSSRITPIEELKLRDGEIAYLFIREGTFQDRPVYKLSLEFPNQNGEGLRASLYYYYDKETLFRVGYEYGTGFGAASGIVVVYSDYRQVGGFWYPFKETVLNVPKPHTKLVTAFVLDENVDEYFKLPPPEAYYDPRKKQE